MDREKIKEQPTITEVIEEIKRVLKGSGFRIESFTLNYGLVEDTAEIEIKRINTLS